MLTKTKIQNIIDGVCHDMPVFCVIKDVEQLAMKQETEDNVRIKWKVVDFYKDSGVTLVPAKMAMELIDAAGLVPALSMKGLGTIYDTPSHAFQRKYEGEGHKVYITV